MWIAHAVSRLVAGLSVDRGTRQLWFRHFTLIVSSLASCTTSHALRTTHLDKKPVDQPLGLARIRNRVRRLARPPAAQPDALERGPIAPLAEPRQAFILGQSEHELERRVPRRVEDALCRSEPRSHARPDEERVARADDLQVVELGQRVGDAVADLGRLEAVVREEPASSARAARTGTGHWMVTPWSTIDDPGMRAVLKRSSSRACDLQL